MGDGLIRRGRPGEGDRIVFRRGLEVGGLGRWVSAGGARGRVTSWLWAWTIRGMSTGTARIASPARSSRSGARRREAIMTREVIMTLYSYVP